MQALLAIALLASIDVATAQRAFAELDAMCAHDNSRLWGRTLCGPIVFADPKTREAMTTDGPATIPDSIGIANTAVEWNGKRWTMVMWPLPESVVARRVLLAHESFHRLQPALNLPNASPANAHLDDADARYWLRLELRALARALATGDKESLADALAFREERRELFIKAAEEERALEINEGLAEHTGYALAVPYLRDRVAPLVRRLANADKAERFARSFAYTSGPAYGALIAMRDPRWTRKVKATDDLGTIARRVWQIQETSLRPELYGGPAIRGDEDARAEKKRQMFAGLQATFIDGPVLVIEFEQMSFTFDPNNVQPFGEHGNVYPSMEVRDTWGKIVVTGGALMSADYKKLTVPASGDGYTLTLNEGWEIREGRVRKSASPRD
jgi:hypothetical protein